MSVSDLPSVYNTPEEKISALELQKKDIRSLIQKRINSLNPMLNEFKMPKKTKINT